MRPARLTISGLAMDEKREIAALGALAQISRLDLFRLLLMCDLRGLPAGVIAERLGVQPTSPSSHLKQLHAEPQNVLNS